MKVTHITTHWRKYPSSTGIEKHCYYFNTGEGNMEEEIFSGELVKKIEVPPEHTAPLSKNIRKKDGRTKSGRLGGITYEVENGHATSKNYYPKDMLEIGEAKGLAALLEKIAVQHLKTQGIQTIQTSSTVHQSRLKQLARLGLEARKIYKIDDWLTALEKAG